LPTAAVWSVQIAGAITAPTKTQKKRTNSPQLQDAL
jgi:hypothetical protein